MADEGKLTQQEIIIEIRKSMNTHVEAAFRTLRNVGGLSEGAASLTLLRWLRDAERVVENNLAKAADK